MERPSLSRGSGRFGPPRRLGCLLAAIGGLWATSATPSPAGAADRPNLLLITADDMNWNAVGAFGCPVAGTTPNLDRLAAEGLRFERAHVTIAVCQPSRGALMTGRYPHRSGGEGFFHLRLPGVPTLPDLLRRGGYRVGILGKVGHSTPYGDFAWDMAHDQPELGAGRNPAIYARYAKAFFEEAREAKRPFFLMANSHDPHRPFFGNDTAAWYQPGKNPPAARPSRVFSPGEVEVPGFLPDLPDVRLEVSEYYASVRRCDDTVGALLAALREAGAEADTLVAFLSDNGMAFPFAKTNCYLHSTRTPWIIRWPGRVAPGSVDRDHFVSGIDWMPTALEAAGLPLPSGMDGASFLPLLRGEPQAGRDRVFTQFHQTSGRNLYPMRCVQTRRFGYIYNAWADGQTVFRNESQAGRTMKAMQAAAATDAALAARVELFLQRVPEELYDFQEDPDALRNLAGDPAHRETLEAMRRDLEAWMEKTGDPALEAFRKRDDPAARASLLKQLETTQGGKTAGGGGKRKAAGRAKGGAPDEGTVEE